MRYKRGGQGHKDGDSEPASAEECLKVDVACRCSEITVKLIFGCTSTSLPAAKQSPPPGTLIEFHGEPLPAKGEAIVDREAIEEAY